MRELSLNLLDIAENSVKAGATLITLRVTARDGVLTLSIADDGCGMTEDFVARVRDPYVTTRTTRKVGMGIPLFAMEAQMCDGSLDIQSAVGKGTTVTATFALDHIDRPPLGDLASTVATLLTESSIGGKDPPELRLEYTVGAQSFAFDTRELKEALGGVPVDTPEVLSFVREMITENIRETNGGILI